MKDEFFKAISDQNRRKILFLLKKNTVMAAGEIAEHFDISKPSLSDHLKILRNADLITSEKKGQYIYYKLNTTVFEDVVSWILQLINKEEKNNEKSENL